MKELKTAEQYRNCFINSFNDWENDEGLIRTKTIEILVPRQYQELILELDDLEVPDDFCVANSYYLYGEPGVGKTIKALCMALAFYKYRFIVSRFSIVKEQERMLKKALLSEYTDLHELTDFIFIDSNELLLRYKSTYTNKKVSEWNFFEEVLKKPILIIDDIFKKEYTPAEYSILYNIINGRVLKKIPTIVTSNESLKNMEANKVMDDRLARRLSDFYLALKVTKNW